MTFLAGIVDEAAAVVLATAFLGTVAWAWRKRTESLRFLRWIAKHRERRALRKGDMERQELLGNVRARADYLGQDIPETLESRRTYSVVVWRPSGLRTYYPVTVSARDALLAQGVNPRLIYFLGVPPAPVSKWTSEDLSRWLLRYRDRVRDQ